MTTKNNKLLLTSGALAIFAVLAVQGCSSSGDDSASAGAAGASAAGKGGTAAGGSGTAGSSTAGGDTSAAGVSAGGAGAEGGAAGAGTEAGAAGTSAIGAAGAGGASNDVVDCVTFCADEEATCTFDTADKAPYASSAACMSACGSFTPGDVAHDGLDDPDPVISGDTYACRRWHLSKAGSTPGTPATAATHCPHTGLLSKVAYADTTATGPCQ